jgi:hypothetical protein
MIEYLTLLQQLSCTVRLQPQFWLVGRLSFARLSGVRDRWASISIVSKYLPVNFDYSRNILQHCGDRATIVVEVANDA